MTGYGIEWGASLRKKFDTNKLVSKTVDFAKRKVIRQALYIRSTAKHSIRSAKSYMDHSAPGKPPLSHSGLLKRFIFSDWDDLGGSVVVGPAIINASSRHTKSSVPVPQLLEEGGDFQRLQLPDSQHKDSWWETQHMAARPYMAPALEKSKTKLSMFWEQAQIS